MYVFLLLMCLDFNKSLIPSKVQKTPNEQTSQPKNQLLNLKFSDKLFHAMICYIV